MFFIKSIVVGFGITGPKTGFSLLSCVTVNGKPEEIVRKVKSESDQKKDVTTPESKPRKVKSESVKTQESKPSKKKERTPRKEAKVEL